MSRNFVPAAAGIVAAVASLALIGTGAQSQNAQSAMKMPMDASITKAVAVLHPTTATEGNDVRGTVTFTKVGPERIRVVADLTGLTPGKHGFHIHEFGDCSAPDGSSAGGHFNPYKAPHAASDVMPRHVGDLGNIEADASGNAHIDLTRSLLDFQGKASILGRGVIVHAKADDLTSQPSGDAGGRLACGVIGVAKTP